MSDISPVAAAALPSFNGAAPVRPAATSPLTAVDLGLATELASVLTPGLTSFSSGSTIVELSAAGQVLSAAAIFQGNLAALQPGSPDSGLGQNFGTDFASLAAEAQNFADSFNNVQGSLGSLQGPFGSLAGQALAAPFLSALNQQATASFAGDESNLTRLAQIGINFVPPDPATAFVTGGSLSVDLDVMRQAFESDPDGSFSLLAQSVRSFESLAADFTTEVSSHSQNLATLAQSIALTETLSLFGSSLFGAGSGLQGLSSPLSGSFSSLLLLASLSQGNRSTVQQLAAVSQFTLVGSLLE